MRRADARRRGFTLIEAIIALTMFGVIMAAVSFAVAAVLQASQRSQQRLDVSADARGLLGFLERDIQSAFVSATDESSVFIGNGGDGGSRDAGNMGALTFATSLHKIEAPELSDGDPSQAGAQTKGNGAAAPPQSDVERVRYEFDPETGAVRRQHTSAPSLSLLTQQSPTQETVVAQNVLDFKLRFWDSEKRTWRTSWDFQQTNQKRNKPRASSKGGGDEDMSLKGDDLLPSAVEATVVMRKSDGSSAAYTVVIPIHAVQPLAEPPPPPAQGTYNDPNNSPNTSDGIDPNGGNPNGGAPSTPRF